MLPVSSDVGPRRRILFLGSRSFELEEAAVDAIGRRSLRSVLLVGFEVCWLVAKMRKASLDPETLRFMGRLTSGCRSVAVWVHGEEEGGSSIQIVVTEGKRRAQLFFLMSAFGDGWGDLALVKHPGGVRGMGLPISTPMAVANRGMATVVQEVHTALEGEWFQLLDRALVGHLRGVGDERWKLCYVGDGLLMVKICCWNGGHPWPSMHRGQNHHQDQQNGSV
ncbi:hypothetical protein CsSME_00030527 [Camellia sinensis var. sinensis]